MIKSSLESNLEIFIITYNRAHDLDKTLDCLYPRFKSVKITILDNHSLDITTIIATSWAGCFKNLKYIRHPRNIGADANNLRAVELSCSIYTWIICDDDKILADEMEDVIENIEQGVVDRISLKFNARNIRPGSLLFHTFTPACIFKTNTFTDAFIRQGYLNNLMPQFHYHLYAEKNLRCYISRNTVILKDYKKASYSTFRFLVSWFGCCGETESRLDRWRTIRQLPLIKTFIYCYVIDRKHYPADWKKELDKLLKVCDIEFKILFLALYLLLLISPTSLIKCEVFFDGDR